MRPPFLIDLLKHLFVCSQLLYIWIGYFFHAIKWLKRRWNSLYFCDKKIILVTTTTIKRNLNCGFSWVWPNQIDNNTLPAASSKCAHPNVKYENSICTIQLDIKQFLYSSKSVANSRYFPFIWQPGVGTISCDAT